MLVQVQVLSPAFVFAACSGSLWGQDSRAEAGPPTPADAVKFTRDIRPILARHCFSCHGPDENQRNAKLRLDIKEDALGDRDGTRPFVPGSIEESEALRRISSDDPTEQMPPGGKEKRLSGDEVSQRAATSRRLSSTCSGSIPGSSPTQP